MHLALLEERSDAIAVFTLECPDGKFPSVGAHHPAAIRLERTITDLYGFKPTGAADTQALARSRLLGRDPAARQGAEARGRSLSLRVPARGRRGSAPDPGRPGPCRHHRARAFPLHRQRRDGGAARTAARLCAQGHRWADDRRDTRQGREARLPHLWRQHRCLCARLRAGRGVGATDQRAGARGLAARADGRARAPRQSFRRYRRHLQRRLLLADLCRMRHPARAHAYARHMPVSATG